MNALKEWIKRSREQQRRTPERYLASYPELVMDKTHVTMTPELFARIEQSCGRYDGTLPTGEYLGKMFVRGGHLCWFGISKENPQTHVALKSRKIIIK